ncbi:MAG: SDR family NAD(P)-dependent oxidoreductase [Dehalococcoidia bacterium]
MGTLDGKVALVTGAANKRSMGHEIVLRLAKEGAKIILVDKEPNPKSLFPGDEKWGGMDEVVSEVKSFGSDALGLAADISKSKEVDSVIEKAVQKFGRVDILVHCAAIRGPVGPTITELSEDEWKLILDVNTTGTFLIARAVAKQMIAKGEGGKIVLFASLAGTKGVPGSGAYCVSKWGVIGLAKTMAIELAQHKIYVNAISPGAIITNLRDNAFEKMGKDQGISTEEARQADYKKFGAAIPLGRLGTPQDIADLAYFLVSDQSNYITGEAIIISGGIT